MTNDLQAQRLREIDDLLAECQRHGMSGIRVSYAQLRAMRDAVEDNDAARVAQVRETVKLREQLAPMLGAIIEPEFRKALLWLLWHHQGGSSRVGQPIRSLLGIGKHDRLTDDQLAAAESFATVPPAATAAVPDDELCEALIEASDMRWNGDVYIGDGADLMNLVRAAMLAATPAPVAQKVPDDVARDAARYRWLRSCRAGNHTIWELCSGYAELLSEKPLDDAIDSAMLAAAQAQEGPRSDCPQCQGSGAYYGTSPVCCGRPSGDGECCGSPEPEVVQCNCSAAQAQEKT